MRHRDTSVRVYEAPAPVHAPREGSRWGAVAWALPALILGAVLAYTLVGIYVQRFWP